MFASASIGVHYPDALATELEALRDRHHCGKGGLKAKDLGAKLGPVARDLAPGLIAHDAAVFIVANHAEAEDYRDLTYDEAAALGVFLEREELASTSTKKLNHDEGIRQI